LTSVNGVPYTWDANGNLLNDGSKDYVYDQANRLINISASGLSWSATYNGDGARLRQVTNGVPTTYTLDLAAPLVMALQERTGATTKQYVYGMGDSPLASHDGTAWTYLSGRDGLNSVRQETDAAGNVLAVRDFDPYGMALQGNAGQPFGYTGEQTDSYINLVFLRARYMQPGLGMFLSRDPWSGDDLRPGSMNGWNYVEGNPTNHSDPAGMYRWGVTFDIPPYHFLIENWYEQLPLVNPNKQIEYHIPNTGGRHADMFNSVTGDVYEIEPWDKFKDGALQVTGYVQDLQRASSLKSLVGWYAGIQYDWNNTEFRAGMGRLWPPGSLVDWPGKYRRAMPGAPVLDIVADYDSEGVVLYWLEPNVLVDYGLLPFSIPFFVDKNLVKPHDWARGRALPQPAYVLSWQDACRVILIATGVGIIMDP
jgi:RHS repeat-associated protein